MRHLMYTVNPGIEDLAAREIASVMGGRVEYRLLSGRIHNYVETLRLSLIPVLRMINRAVLVLWDGEVGPGLSDLLTLYDKLPQEIGELTSYVTPSTPFAVVAERFGEHEYTSMDIARVIGDLVGRIVEAKHGSRPPVNLRAPSVIIYVLLRGNELSLGILLTGHGSMHRRPYRIYDHPASLKPVLAQAMLALADTRDGDTIMDPMCGGGTVAIEAALLHEDAEIICMDKNPLYIKYAKANAAAARVREKIKFIVGDARRLGDYGVEPTHIVTNPPYGIRYGNPAYVRRLYSDFIAAAADVLDDRGRLVMITTEYIYARRIGEKHGLSVIHERTVHHGGLYPHILVFSRNTPPSV